MYLVKTIGALGDAVGDVPGGLLAPRAASSQPPTVDALSFFAVGMTGIVAGALGLWLWERSSARRGRHRR